MRVKWATGLCLPYLYTSRRSYEMPVCTIYISLKKTKYVHQRFSVASNLIWPVYNEIKGSLNYIWFHGPKNCAFCQWSELGIIYSLDWFSAKFHHKCHFNIYVYIYVIIVKIADLCIYIQITVWCVHFHFKCLSRDLFKNSATGS